MKMITKGLVMENKESNMFAIIVGCGLAALILVVGYAGWDAAATKTKMDKQIAKLEQTPSGAFAVKYLDECHNTSIFKKSELICASQVISGARDLKGQGFADEVAFDITTIMALKNPTQENISAATAASKKLLKKEY